MASTYTNMSTSTIGGHTVASEDVAAELRQLDEEIHNAYGSFSNSSLSIAEDEDRDRVREDDIQEIPTHEPQEPNFEKEHELPDPMAETRRASSSSSSNEQQQPPVPQQPVRPYEGNVEVRIQQAESQLRMIQAKLGESAEVLKEVNRAAEMAADSRRESFDELGNAVRLISEVRSNLFQYLNVVTFFVCVLTMLVLV